MTHVDPERGEQADAATVGALAGRIAVLEQRASWPRELFLGIAAAAIGAIVSIVTGLLTYATDERDSARRASIASETLDFERKKHDIDSAHRSALAAQTQQFESAKASDAVQLAREKADLERAIDERKHKNEQYVAELATFNKIADWLVDPNAEKQKRALIIIASMPGDLFRHVTDSLATDDKQRQMLSAAARQVEKALPEPAPASKSRLVGQAVTCERATNFTRAQVTTRHADMDAQCVALKAISREFSGPWGDGSISVKSLQKFGDIELWCNCKLAAR